MQLSGLSFALGVDVVRLFFGRFFAFTRSPLSFRAWDTEFPALSIRGINNSFIWVTSSDLCYSVVRLELNFDVFVARFVLKTDLGSGTNDLQQCFFLIKPLEHQLPPFNEVNPPP